MDATAVARPRSTETQQPQQHKKATGKGKAGAQKPAARPKPAPAVTWAGAELEALFARVTSIVDGGAAEHDHAMEGGAIGLLPRLAQAYGGADSVIEGVARDIETGCRLANAAVLAAAAPAGALAGPTEEERARVRVSLSALYYVNQAISASTVAFRTIAAAAAGNYGSCDGEDSGEALAAGIARFSAPDPDETNRVQQLLLYLLNTAQVNFSLFVGDLGLQAAARPGVSGPPAPQKFNQNGGSAPRPRTESAWGCVGMRKR